MKFKKQTCENYDFNCHDALLHIVDKWTSFSRATKCNKFVLGISGGKDSLVVAKLGTICFDNENIIGVMMPNGEQNDIKDAQDAINNLGIVKHFVNIKTAFDDIINRVSTSGSKNTILSNDTIINLPPRLRMAILYAIAQSEGAMVLNTDNLSERTQGYSTLWGDSVGSYAPIQNLTVTEVIKLGDYLNLPSGLVHKKPGDGLQVLGDEDRLGLSYADLDIDIRTGKCEKIRDVAMRNLNKNRFKSKMIKLPGPHFDFLPVFGQYKI